MAGLCLLSLFVCNLKVLIYVFDVESTEGAADLERYRGVLEAVEANSPDARYAHSDPSRIVPSFALRLLAIIRAARTRKFLFREEDLFHGMILFASPLFSRWTKD